MKKSNLTKSLAAILAMSMMLGSVPVSAAEIPTTETEIETEIETTETETEIETDAEVPETETETEVESETETETPESILESETKTESETEDETILESETDETIDETESNEPEDDIEIGNFPAGGVAINSTNFPDSNFRNVIRDKYDYNKNGYLSYSEAESTTNLYLYRYGITNTKGIEYFFNAEDINLASNNLSSLNLSQNKNLKFLDCSGNNNLTQLNLTQNPLLESLLCYEDNLSQINISGNPKLQTLFCGGNHLTKLDTSKNPRLKALSCYANNLRSINLSNNTALTEFNCYNNDLSQLDVRQNPKLEFLFCDSNNLTQLDVSKNTELLKLGCSSNNLTQLDLGKNKKLTFVDFQMNHIPAISFSNNYALEAVYGDNQTVNTIAYKTSSGTYVVDFISLIPSHFFRNIQVSGFNYNPSKGKLTLNNTYASKINYNFTYVSNYSGSMNVTMNISYSDLPFYDVAKNAWYYSSVKYVYENDLLTGTDRARFSPNDSMTRGMLVSVLYRLEGRPNVSGNSFPDVNPRKYYDRAIRWAAKNGIVSGYSNGKFGPEDPITREQMMKIFYNYVEFKGKNMSGSSNLYGYSDANTISPYAVKYVKWAVANGILTGSNGKLNPKGNATRAEVSAILKRVIETYNLK